MDSTNSRRDSSRPPVRDKWLKMILNPTDEDRPVRGTVSDSSTIASPTEPTLNSEAGQRRKRGRPRKDASPRRENVSTVETLTKVQTQSRFRQSVRLLKKR